MTRDILVKRHVTADIDTYLSVLLSRTAQLYKGSRSIVVTLDTIKSEIYFGRVQ